MNEEEIRKRNNFVRKAVGKALDEYLFEGPENDDRWNERTVQELTEDFGTYLNIGTELNEGWLDEQGKLVGGWFDTQNTKNRAFRDREDDIWVEFTPNGYVCVTEDDFMSSSVTILGLVPSKIEDIDRTFGPVKEI
jgi:hypothetical protein